MSSISSIIQYFEYYFDWLVNTSSIKRDSSGNVSVGNNVTITGNDNTGVASPGSSVNIFGNLTNAVAYALGLDGGVSNITEGDNAGAGAENGVGLAYGPGSVINESISGPGNNSIFAIDTGGATDNITNYNGDSLDNGKTTPGSYTFDDNWTNRGNSITNDGGEVVNLGGGNTISDRQGYIYDRGSGNSLEETAGGEIVNFGSNNNVLATNHGAVGVFGNNDSVTYGGSASGTGSIIVRGNNLGVTDNVNSNDRFVVSSNGIYDNTTHSWLPSQQGTNGGLYYTKATVNGQEQYTILGG